MDEAAKRDKEINDMLRKERKRLQEEIKLLLLGTHLSHLIGTRIDKITIITSHLPGFWRPKKLAEPATCIVRRAALV
jgi:hypothetical protein